MMTNHTAKNYSLGANFVDSPHAVSSSLPTMADVIGYEEHQERVHAKIQGGYPRFKRHRYLHDLSKVYLSEQSIDHQSSAVRFVASEKDAHAVAQYVKDATVNQWHTVWVIVYPNDAVYEKRAHKILQHTGMALSSREAESLLVLLGEKKDVFAEARVGSYEEAEKLLLSSVENYLEVSKELIHLSKCGMNAIYSLVTSVRATSSKRWLRIGWLYVDTMHLLDEFAGVDAALSVTDVLNINQWIGLIEENATDLAGVFVEFPTNPLVQSADLIKLSEVCHHYGIPVVVDVSLNGLQTVNPFPYADAVTCSLTKYFGNSCDVLGGVMVFAENSLFSAELQSRFSTELSPLCSRSVQRLAHVSTELPVLQEKISKNTRALVEFFTSHPAVKNVYWSGESSVRENYEQVGNLSAPGCMISLDLAMPLVLFYDRIQLAKGPSFGAQFTMLCPYMYLAHYDGIKDPSLLKGINPELVRISVGPEPIDELVDVFAAALE